MSCLDVFQVHHVILGELGDGMGKVEAERPPELGDLVLRSVLHSDAFKRGHVDRDHVLQDARPQHWIFIKNKVEQYLYLISFDLLGMAQCWIGPENIRTSPARAST